jgi:hypothetical protein
VSASLLVMSLAVAACGGGSSSSSTHTTATAQTTATQSQASQGGTSSVTTGPVHGALIAKDHAPQAGKLWPYAVHVSDAAGHPLSGTVDIEFVFGGQVVGRDTPPTHPVRNGLWHDKLTFPAPAVGEPLMFRAVVHTSLGTITLDWPVKVRT